MSDELLPKPLTDLPLPEKELPEHATEPVIVKNETPENHGRSPILKFLLLGFLVALILAAIGGAYVIGKNSVYKELNPTSPAIPPKDPDVYNPSPTSASSPSADTSNWKTYTNSQNGYSIKYPGDTFVRLICPDEELTLIKRDSQTEVEINMPTCARGGRYDIEIISNQELEEPTTNQYVTVEKEDITVDGKPAIKYMSTKKLGVEGPIPEYEENIFVTNNDKKYLIYLAPSINEDLKNTILSTFKLTN